MQKEVSSTYFISGQRVPDFIPFRAMVGLSPQHLEDSPPRASSIQSALLSSRFQIHELKFAGCVTMLRMCMRRSLHVGVGYGASGGRGGSSALPRRIGHIAGCRDGGCGYLGIKI